MSAAFDTLKQSLTALSREERLILANYILADGDEALLQELEDAHREMLRRRVEDIRSSKVQGITWEELRSQLDRPKP